MTEAQKVFCDQYLIDLNATRAYKVAYPKCKTLDTARKLASRLMTIDDVKNYIQERIQERQKRTEVTQDMVIEELKAIAFANATDFARVQKGIVRINDTDNIDLAVKKAIVGIKEGKNGIEVSMANKMQALEMLGRHLGMFKDKVEVTNNTSEITAEIDKYIKEKMMTND